MLRKILKWLGRLFLGLLGLIGLFILAVVIFMYTQPQIGQKPQGADLERIQKSPHYDGEGFVNLAGVKEADFWEAMRKMPEFFFAPGGAPTDTLPVRFGENTAAPVDSICFVTWYGHSAFLVEMEGKRILIDPMLGPTPSPAPFGAGRFPYEEPIPIDELTDIDALIISHDHYDHLDYPTIIELKDEVSHFYTALGVGSHLKFWGVDSDKITELDWWGESELDGIRLVACPSQHFSGRGFSDGNCTQWASWVIEGEHIKLYFSGDGGYGDHFVEIGEQEGPFDFAMMECGQYNEAWSDIHMMPEQSVQAGLDVKGELLMPIHWGAFDLSLHTWTDPIERFKAEAERLNAPIIHPYIGERFAVGSDFPRATWWEI